MSTTANRTNVLLLLAASLVLASPARSAGQDARYLHALVIADTNDAIIGPDVNIDGKNVYTRLVQEVPWHRLGLTRLIGDKVTQDDIFAYYQKLSVQSNDAVFCFFAGHGAVEGGDHVIMMTDGAKLRRADLLAAMKKKGARLTVLVTDSCAREETQTRAPVYELVKPDRVELCRYLFFRHTGVVDVNSSSPPDQLAYGDGKYGGVFTSAFHEYLARPNRASDKNGDGTVSWQEFFGAVSARTQTNFNLLRQKNPSLQQTKQTPKAWELAYPVASARIRFESLRMGIGVVDAAGGARIAQVYPGSPAEWYGLRTGEVLYEIDRMNDGDTTQVVATWPITGVDSLTKTVRTLTTPTLLRCKVRDQAGGKQRTVYVRTLGMGP